jgi:DNA-binding NarL/FixJ family response regulator
MKPISVLLAENNGTFRRTVAAFLEHESRQEVQVVGTASTGDEALAQAACLRPDVVVIDLRMPGLPAFETIHRLRGVVPQAGIIALTFLDGDGYRQASLGAGAHDLVGKTRIHSDLLPAIRGVARSCAPADPSARAAEAAPDAVRSDPGRGG